MKIRKNWKASFKPDPRAFKLYAVVEGEDSLENSVTPSPKNRTGGIYRLLRHPLMNSIVGINQFAGPKDSSVFILMCRV